LIVSQACVRWGKVDLAQAREVESDWWLGVPGDGRIQAGDVLVNSTGEGTIGRAAVATAEAQGLPVDSHVLMVRCDTRRLIPEFLAIYLRSPAGQRQVEWAKGAKTTKQTELGKAKLERFLVPLPDVTIQRRVVLRFLDLEARVVLLEERIAAQAKRFAAVTPSLINEIFCG
jgi:restriction endonuclease S subunit